MDWKARIAAVVLAGGSVAGCASAADPGDAGAPETEAGTALHPLSERLPQPKPARVRIPLCNANPDPCCRFPHSSSCQEGAPPTAMGKPQSYTQ